MFIVIDGIDGSGKGTQTKLVQDELTKKWKTVLELDFPRYGEKSAYFVERYLNGDYGKNISAELASIMYALDRFDALHDVDFSAYDYVISNRYVSASMLHQAGKIENKQHRNKFLKWLEYLEYEITGIPQPDKVLFLDVPPHISQKLVEQKQQRDYIVGKENKDIHEADIQHLQNAYDVAQEVIEMFPNWEKIDCCENGDILPIEVITQKILTNIL